MKHLLKSQLMQWFCETDSENQSDPLLMLIYYFKPAPLAQYLAAFMLHPALCATRSDY